MSLPPPYYQDEYVTIYHANCRDVAPNLGKFDLLLTDPLYGIKADEAASKNKGKWGWKDYGSSNWDRERPTKEDFDIILSLADYAIIWGGNYFADLLPPSMGWLAWDKEQRNFSLADFEMAWTSFWVAARCFDYSRAKAMQDGKQHPTQKPISLMNFCINHADERAKTPMNTIIDPFMGSGTTLRSAKDLGRKAVGIEINEAYCEIAANRMAQEVFAL